jgi:CRP-like cAMP-binding protein
MRGPGRRPAVRVHIGREFASPDPAKCSRPRPYGIVAGSGITFAVAAAITLRASPVNGPSSPPTHERSSLQPAIRGTCAPGGVLGYFADSMSWRLSGYWTRAAATDLGPSIGLWAVVVSVVSDRLLGRGRRLENHNEAYARIELLRNVWFFERCTNKELDALAKRNAHRPAGWQGACDAVNKAPSSSSSSKGGRGNSGNRYHRYVGTGSFFGEMSLLERLLAAHRHDDQPTTVLVLTAKAFDELVAPMPSVDRKMLIVLAKSASASSKSLRRPTSA